MVRLPKAALQHKQLYEERKGKRDGRVYHLVNKASSLIVA